MALLLASTAKVRAYLARVRVPAACACLLPCISSSGGVLARQEAALARNVCVKPIGEPMREVAKGKPAVKTVLAAPKAHTPGDIS